jgi:hypothetical protein
MTIELTNVQIGFISNAIQHTLNDVEVSQEELTIAQSIYDLFNSKPPTPINISINEGMDMGDKLG